MATVSCLLPVFGSVFYVNYPFKQLLYSEYSRVSTGFEKYEIGFKYFPGLEKYGKNKSEYGNVFVFPCFCPYLFFS